MANYTPKAVWHQEIDVISDTDQVQGSAIGAANLPHQQLADSAAYLLARLVALETGASLEPPPATGNWAVAETGNVAFQVGLSPSFVAENTNYLSRSFLWTATLQNIDSLNAVTDSSVVNVSSTGKTDATGRFTSVTGKIPALALGASTVSQRLRITIAWGGTEQVDAVHPYEFVEYIAVAPAAAPPVEQPPYIPPPPSPTEGFSAIVNHSGSVGASNGSASATGYLVSNALDGTPASITQYINYNNAKSGSGYQKTKVDTVISNGSWAASFDLQLRGAALTAAGTQSNIFQISYGFNISGQRGWEKIVIKHQ